MNQVIRYSSYKFVRFPTIFIFNMGDISIHFSTSLFSMVETRTIFLFSFQFFSQYFRILYTRELYIICKLLNSSLPNSFLKRNYDMVFTCILINIKKWSVLIIIDIYIFYVCMWITSE